MTEQPTDNVSSPQDGAVDKPAVLGSAVLEVVYTWQNGREEVRYRRSWHSEEGNAMRQEVDALIATAKARGYVSPYSYRAVDSA